jgi:ferritin-like metal-binding protein YciE
MNPFEQGMTRLLVAQLSELYHCESELLHGLQEMADAAQHEELRSFFAQHRQETIGHVRRLEAMFESLAHEPRALSCRAMEGQLLDITLLIGRLKDDAVLDIALVAAAQKMELMEVASYRSAAHLARQLGLEGIAEQCEHTLLEEREADRKLQELSHTLEGEHA